ncbi:MAG: fructose-6-phosphate aldolase [Nitrospinota bacterium]|nr:fructose-6-phosphate aldolase [Nitrospinota bacterium]MDH5679170.1 fructose-6-phosphate aldolase [Nitrospinota bacterium]MDH5757831.1 fructose-6-phosphate aldolase [Nitrospinota bacterium]
MKIFIDSADIKEIREANSLGVVDGVTTNPSLVAKTGKDFKTVINEIVAEVDGPISAEVIGLEADAMVAEARLLAAIHANIVVKIPMTVEGLKAVKILSGEGIHTNVTLIFSPSQALLAAKAGATYVSPFVGRLDDISHDGMETVAQIMDIYNAYGFETEVIVASIRHPLHLVQAARMGADVATIPLDVIKKLTGHPLTDIGIERFLADWEKVPKG